MKVLYSHYTLTPIKRANRLSSLEKKQGVLVKGVLGNKVTFADYYPHIPLGDRPVELFLEEFKFQKVEYDQKVFDLLLKDHEFQNLKPKKVFAHQLWTGTENIESQTVKYKLLYAEDRSFMSLLEKGIRVRLDGNALFTRVEYERFVSEIPQNLHSLIDYLEDPLKEKDWSNLKLKSAQDFIEGSPIDYYIYKPNCEFKPKLDVPLVYSGYLGSSFGFWHTYCDLVQNGDVSVPHGLIARGFYEEEKDFYEGSYLAGFMPKAEVVRSMYQDASNLNWKTLCSI